MRFSKLPMTLDEQVMQARKRGNFMELVSVYQRCFSSGRDMTRFGTTNRNVRVLAKQIIVAAKRELASAIREEDWEGVDDLRKMVEASVVLRPLLFAQLRHVALGMGAAWGGEVPSEESAPRSSAPFRGNTRGALPLSAQRGQTNEEFADEFGLAPLGEEEEEDLWGVESWGELAIDSAEGSAAISAATAVLSEEASVQGRSRTVTTGGTAPGRGSQSSNSSKTRRAAWTQMLKEIIDSAREEFGEVDQEMQNDLMERFSADLFAALKADTSIPEMEEAMRDIGDEWLATWTGF